MEFTLEEFNELIDSYFVKNEHSEDWKFGKKFGDDIITVWTKTDGPKIYDQTSWVKSTTVFDVSMELMHDIYVEHCFDFATSHKMVDKFERIEKSEDTDLVLLVLGVPIPFSSWRYSLLRRRWRVEKDNRMYYIDKSIDIGDRKLPINIKKYVLMQSVEIGMFEPVDGGKKTKRTIFNANHFGGNIQSLGKAVERLGGQAMITMKKLEGGYHVMSKFTERYEKKRAKKC